jgi:hypothetical protein
MIPFPKELFTLQDQRNLLEFLALKASIVAARRAAPLFQSVTGTAINSGIGWLFSLIVYIAYIH